MTNYELFISIFQGRRDVIPKYYDFTGKDGERIVGYTPICAKSGKSSCPKKQGTISACRECGAHEYVPMSESLLQQHFDGKLILGIYPMLPDGVSCNFIAGDFDNHGGDRNPKEDVKKLLDVCECQEISAYALKSKSGNGYHVYLFFAEKIPALKARRVFFALLEEAGITTETSFDRMFPNQDTSNTGKGFGNLIALPFQNISHPDNFRNTGFLMPDLETLIPEQWDYLSKIKRVSDEQLDALVSEWKIDLSEKPVKSNNPKQEKINPITVISGLPEGERDTKLFRYACQLRSKGLSQSEIEILVCHAAGQCTPPFSKAEALVKVASAMKYDYTDSALPASENWLQDALKPQKGDAVQRTARMLASYWLHQLDDKEQVRLSLFGWNIANNPPLSAEELETILSGSDDRQAFDNFQRATKLPISYMELCKYPDGNQEYRMYIQGIAQPAIFDSAGLITKSTFIKKIHELTQVVLIPPSEKGQPGTWAQLITGISKAATIIEMPEEMTVMERLRQIIQSQIDNHDTESEHDYHDEIEKNIIIYNGNILFKANTIMMRCKFESSEELKRLSRKEINDMLSRMGFELPVKHTSIKSKNFKVFKCSLSSFMSYST